MKTQNHIVHLIIKQQKPCCKLQTYQSAQLNWVLLSFQWDSYLIKYFFILFGENQSSSFFVIQYLNRLWSAGEVQKGHAADLLAGDGSKPALLTLKLLTKYNAFLITHRILNHLNCIFHCIPLKKSTVAVPRIHKALKKRFLKVNGLKGL